MSVAINLSGQAGVVTGASRCIDQAILRIIALAGAGIIGHAAPVGSVLDCELVSRTSVLFPKVGIVAEPSKYVTLHQYFPISLISSRT